ncbi:MAG: prefoldin subunit alpha [Candidatus Micrarchaeota archaeon]
MSDEEDLNKLAIKAQLLSREGQVLQGQIDMVQGAVTDLNATIDTLKNIKKAKEGTIVPVGSGAYISCKEVDIETILVSVGAGFILKKNVKDAVEILEGRRVQASDSLEKAQKALLSVNESLQEINARASVITARMENVQPVKE